MSTDLDPSTLKPGECLLAWQCGDRTGDLTTDLVDVREAIQQLLTSAGTNAYEHVELACQIQDFLRKVQLGHEQVALRSNPLDLTVYVVRAPRRSCWERLLDDEWLN